MADFLHGVEVQTQAVAKAAADINMSVIGVIGIAPYADPKLWPLDTPILVSGADTALITALTATAPEGIADLGTLPDAFASMLEETSPIVIAIRVEGNASYTAETLPKIVGGIDSAGRYTGLHAFLIAEAQTGYRPRLLCAPGYTHQTAKNALTRADLLSEGKGYKPGVYNVTVDDAKGSGASVEATIGNNGGISRLRVLKSGQNYTSPNLQLPVEAGNGSGAKIAAAIGSGMNAVLSELNDIAQRLRAVVFADCDPNAAIPDVIKFAKDLQASRIMMIDPWLTRQGKQGNVSYPPSAKFAAKQAWTDQNEGFWRSVSNHSLNGILSLSRPVDFVAGDTSCGANMLNANNVSTVIRRPGLGFVSWGNRALDGSFLCVVRTVDDVNETLLNAALQFVDRGIDRNFVTEIVEFVNAYLRQLKAKGAILDGKCWADTKLNTAAAVTNGQVYFNFDIGPVYPAERITFRSTINDDYITTVFAGSGS